ncbi:hybrid sensor histidine kinase/response regulator [Muricoccus aerilatus]|uniref:hybrid sensor histidine kinase/response regulator n=1 Tax=Muricoccus aerilatus TaxID=452982 RepID=UPI0009FD5F26|nr:PAS domain-containing sensor histidine kinase [Roseomonas aerilata]
MERDPAVDDASYRLLVEAVVDYAIYLLDRDGRVRTWNPGGERLKGYRAEEIIGQPFTLFFTEEDRRRGLPETALETARRVGRFESEGWRLRKDGSRFWALAVIDAVRDPAGEVIGFAKITRDMTDRYEAQRAVVETERRFRLLVEGVTDYAIFMLHPNGTIANWNAGARRIHGYEADEIVGEHFSRFYTEEDRAAGLPARALAEARTTGRFEVEAWRIRKDGSRVWAGVVIDAIRDEAGEVIGFAKITRDLSERRRVEQALQESERRFRLLVNGVTDYAIFMLDPNGAVVNWNAGARLIKGYEAEEIVGQHFSRFYTKEDREWGVPWRALAEARSAGRFEAEGWRVRKDGSRFWASVVIDAIRDDDGAIIGFAKITRDITGRRESQLALDEARQQLVQAQKLEALGQLTGGVAHDFNNLLQVISSGIDMAERLAGGDRRLGGILAEVRNATKRGAELTSQLLTFSRRAPLRPEVVGTEDCLKQAVGLIRRSLPPQVSLRTALDGGLWPIRIDVGQLEVALLNLAVNARDAMPGGGTLTLRARNAELSGEPQGLSGPHVAIALRDTGAGIPAEVLLRVFEPFFTTKPIGKGTGLGLSQVHGFAEGAGGRVTIRSAPDEGTEVTLFIPALPGAEADRPEDGLAQADGSQRLPAGLRVLVVDDDLAVARLTAGMLEAAGCRPETTNDPRKALRWLEAGRTFDMLLLDVVMPGSMSGLELAKEVQRRWPGVPILLATGYTADEGALTGKFDLLRKPFTALELTRTMTGLGIGAPAPGAGAGAGAGAGG